MSYEDLTNEELDVKLKELHDQYLNDIQEQKRLEEELKEQIKLLRRPAQWELRRISAVLLERIYSNGWRSKHSSSGRKEEFYKNLEDWGKISSGYEFPYSFGSHWDKDTLEQISDKLLSNTKDRWKEALGINFEIDSIRKVVVDPTDGVFYDEVTLKEVERPYRSKSDGVVGFVRKAGKTAECFIVTASDEQPPSTTGRRQYIQSLFRIGDEYLRGVCVGFNPRSGKIQIGTEGSARYLKKIYYPNQEELLTLFKEEEKKFKEKIRADAAIHMLDSDPYIRWCAGVEHQKSKKEA